MKRDELFELIRNQRDNAPQQDIITRAALVVPTTLNETDRSVRTTLTTEDAVPVWDNQNGRIVLEVLMVTGATFDPQTPLLRDHEQYSVDSIIGSITDVNPVRDTLDGLLTFGTDLDPTAEGIWRRVKQGHLRRVSIGYQYTRNDYVTIPAGQTQTVQGRSFTAPKERDLRIVFRWYLAEVSVVVIPADKRAQMRSGQLPAQQRGTDSQTAPNSQTSQTPVQAPNTRSENEPVNELYQFLCRNGMPAETAQDTATLLAWARQHLNAARHAELLTVCQRNSITVDASHFQGERAANQPTPPTQTPASPAPATAPAAPAPAPATPGVDPVAAERQRASSIRSMATEHPTVPQAVVNRCLDEGLSVDQAREAFLVALRGSTQPPVQGNAPAGHVRGGLTLRALQAGLLMRFGYEPDASVFRSGAAESVYSRRGFDATWLRGAARQGEQRNEVESAYDIARNHGLHNGSMMRFAEALVELDGNRAPWNQDELLERAFSHANFNSLFGAVVHMMMVAGYNTQPNTYQQIARVIDVPDFRPTQEAMPGGVGRLKKQGKNGGKAALLNIETPTISSVAAERYAGLLKLTDQVFIADSFGVLDMLPEDVGASAAAIPNDLIYSIVLGNPNIADGNPLFVDGTNYITAGALDEEGLNAAGILLVNKVVNGRRILVNSGGLLLHGTTLSVKAKKVLTSTRSADNTDNVMVNTYRRLEDNVVDLGCTNPATDPEAVIAGLPNSYFLFSNPLRSLVAAFRQGTNRGPVSRTSNLSEGEWGRAWDVYIDCGAAATSRTGVVRVDEA